MRAPAVSVVVPCFDMGAYLDEAIDSVLAQTFQDFEIVVVDDGSTDPQTRALLDDYVRPKTRVVRTPNQGLPAARNAGAAHTSGRYLCMLDADDRLAATYMERSVAALESDPGLAFVSHWLRTFGDAETDWRPEACDLEALLAHNTVNGAALVRRSVFDAVGGFDGSMRHGLEDWDFWLRIIEAGGRGTIVPEVLHHYRRHPGSMSHAFADGRSEAYLRSYHALVTRHADSFASRLAPMAEASERAMADLRCAVHDMEIEFAEQLLPERRHLADDVAMLERRAGRGERPHTEAHLLAAVAEVRALRSSWSWRVTAPARAAYGWWLSWRRGGRT
jgi:glycosyltransferase involved in cell wall biosynthesis